MVRTVRLVVSPLTEGVGFTAVDAALPGVAQAQDGRLLALAARTQATRRLVLAAAPGWEARAAADALEAPGKDVAVLTQLGVRAVLARGVAAQPPLTLLRTPGGLGGVDVLTLVGFGPGSLDGGAASALRQYVASGGAVLLLDAPGAAAALGVQLARPPASAPLQALAGQLGGDVVTFQGYAPLPAVRAPPLATVLGRLGPAQQTAARAWVVGRGLGLGRFAVVTAPDAWRLSAPGQSTQPYARLLARLTGWLQAPKASRFGVTLSEDWASLRVDSASGTRFFPLVAGGAVEGLAVDVLDVQRLVRWPRARLRAAAAARRHPFLEVDGAEALAAAWRRLPAAPRWDVPFRLRSSDAAFCALAALLAAEAMARRLYGWGGSSGSRASTDASSGDTGGMTSGDGRSQRDNATPAARAAAARDASSPAA
jgi:hypothetical protein